MYLTGILLFLHATMACCQQSAEIDLFDGKSFKGWEGDTAHTWRIEKGALTGGSLIKNVPQNEFLCTKESFGDFELSFQIKLIGTGFVNAGVQFHSQRLKTPPNEMTGYQADAGKDYWGCLYDESRRDIVLVKASNKIANIVKSEDWNDYKIRSEGNRIQIWINGIKSVDYIERDTTIPHIGYIGLQVHGGGKALVSYRKIKIRKL